MRIPTVILTVAFVALIAEAQLDLTNGEYNFRIFQSPGGRTEDTMRYWVRPPAGFTTSEKLPLLVHMHGTGNKPDDFLMDIFEQGTDRWDNAAEWIDRCARKSANAVGITAWRTGNIGAGGDRCA